MLCDVPLVKVLYLCLSPPSGNWVPTVSWELTCDGLVFHSGGVDDSHLLSTLETGYKHQPYAPSWLGEGFNLTIVNQCLSYYYASLQIIM